MTNEEKAYQIIKDFQNQNRDFDKFDTEDAAMEMAKWKDKQFGKVIEYTETCYGVFCFNEREKFIENIKKLYRGGEL